MRNYLIETPGAMIAALGRRRDCVPERFLARGDRWGRIGMWLVRWKDGRVRVLVWHLEGGQWMGGWDCRIGTWGWLARGSSMGYGICDAHARVLCKIKRMIGYLMGL